MESDIKPCPFCGGHDIHQSDDPNDISYTWEGWTILTECYDCGATVYARAKTKSQAYKASAKAWNTRREPK